MSSWGISRIHSTALVVDCTTRVVNGARVGNCARVVDEICVLKGPGIGEVARVVIVDTTTVVDGLGTLTDVELTVVVDGAVVTKIAGAGDGAT